MHYDYWLMHLVNMRSSIQKLKSYFGLGLVCSEFNGNTITCRVDEKKVWWIQVQGAGLEEQDSEEIRTRGSIILLSVMRMMRP